MYRPLKTEEDRSPAAQSAAGQQKPAASAVQAPTPYTQPGLYGYPAGGPYYGGYPPQPGTYTYPPAPYYGGYGR